MVKWYEDPILRSTSCVRFPLQDATLTKWSTVQRTVHGPSTVQTPSRPVQVRSRYGPVMVQIRSNSTIHGPATIQTVRSVVRTGQDHEPLDRSLTAYGPDWTVNTCQEEQMFARCHSISSDPHKQANRPGTTVVGGTTEATDTHP